MAAAAPLWAEELAEPEEWQPTPTTKPTTKPTTQPATQPATQPRTEASPQVPGPAPAPAPAPAPEPPLNETRHRVAEPDQPAAVERPLFADHERRVPPGAPVVPVASAGAGSGTTGDGLTGGPPTSGGPGTDTSSRFWPFDDPDETGGPSGKEGRSWLQLAAIVALCIAVVVAVFIAFGLGHGKNAPSATPTTPPPTPTDTGSPIKIVAVHDFDPEGDPPEENPGQVGLAVDGNPDTGWRTLTYKGDAALGGLKSGVGLVLDLGSEQAVGSVQVRLGGSPTDLELFATPPGDDNPPVELADTRRVAGVTADQQTTVLRADPAVRTRFLVVWLTRLPAVPGGFRGEIAEVAVRS